MRSGYFFRDFLPLFSSTLGAGWALCSSHMALAGSLSKNSSTEQSKPLASFSMVSIVGIDTSFVSLDIVDKVTPDRSANVYRLIDFSSNSRLIESAKKDTKFSNIFHLHTCILHVCN